MVLFPYNRNLRHERVKNIMERFCETSQWLFALNLNYFHKKVSFRTFGWDRNTPLNTSSRIPPQPTFTCSKLTIETLEQGVKYDHT